MIIITHLNLLFLLRFCKFELVDLRARVPLLESIIVVEDCPANFWENDCLLLIAFVLLIQFGYGFEDLRLSQWALELQILDVRL